MTLAHWISKPWLKFIAGALVLLVVCAFFFLPVTEWDGRVGRDVVVTVLNEDGSQAINGAEVMLLLPLDSNFRKELPAEEFDNYIKEQQRVRTTDQNGQVKLRGEFASGGRKSMGLRTGEIIISGVLIVKHPQFQSYEEVLANGAGEVSVPLNSKNIPLEIRLKKAHDVTHLQPRAD